MRAELPWNVAGIPPEAREAARAAARREGLSVGEWLTRRILRSFSDMSEEQQPMPFDRAIFERTPAERPLDRPGLDPWGLPLSAASRRDTEDMLARVSRSEAESSDSYRRIEEQLRNVGRRLDSAERSQTESTRAMSQAASEINIASREQAQAFDQLGGHVLGLSERLERLERNVSQDPLKDAVKGLHQGLSRLADQIGQTASQSATQISSLAGNLDQLATRLSEARADAETATKALEARISQVETSGGIIAARVARTETSAEAASARIATVEDAVESATSALNRVQEKIEAQAGLRAHDLAELQKWEANHLGSLERIEERIARLENKGPDLAMERRLDNVERALAGVVSRLEQSDPSAALAETLRQVNNRLNAVEKNHAEMLAELRASLGRAPQAAALVAAPSFDPTPEPPAFEAPAFEAPPFPATPVLQPEPVAEMEPEPHFEPLPESFFEPHFEPLPETQPEAQTESQTESQPEPQLETQPEEHAQPHSEPTPEPQPEPQLGSVAEEAPAFTSVTFGESDFAPSSLNNFAQDAFATNFEMPQDFADALAQPTADGDNFLTAARRSAQAAAEAEAGRGGRGFSWRLPISSNAEGADKSSPRYVGILVMGFIALLVIAAVMMLSQRMRAANTEAAKAALPRAAAPQSQTAHPAAAAPAAPSGNHFVPAPQVAPAQKGAAHPAPASHAPVSAPAAPVLTTLAPLQPTQPAATSKAVKPAIGAAKPVAALPPIGAKPAAPSLSRIVPSTDKVAAAANAGNPAAETIIGLKYLDGQGITADPAQALKWLQKGADAGQAVAQYRLGTMYERGQGVTANPTTAAKWYQAAANQGNRKAMHNLAVAFAEGSTGKKDMAESARWFSKAAALGLSDSQFNLAVLYERGDGVPQSLIDAYKWYSIAAATGDAESKTRLAVLQTQLSDTDRAAATRSAQAFHVAPLNRSANVPPEPADLSSN